MRHIQELSETVLTVEEACASAKLGTRLTSRVHKVEGLPSLSNAHVTGTAVILASRDPRWPNDRVDVWFLHGQSLSAFGCLSAHCNREEENVRTMCCPTTKQQYDYRTAVRGRRRHSTFSDSQVKLHHKPTVGSYQHSQLQRKSCVRSVSVLSVSSPRPRHVSHLNQQVVGIESRDDRTCS